MLSELSLMRHSRRPAFLTRLLESGSTLLTQTLPTASCTKTKTLFAPTADASTLLLPLAPPRNSATPTNPRLRLLMTSFLLRQKLRPYASLTKSMESGSPALTILPPHASFTKTKTLCAPTADALTLLPLRVPQRSFVMPTPLLRPAS